MINITQMCTCTWVEGTILRAPEVRNTCIVRCGAEGYILFQLAHMIDVAQKQSQYLFI